MSAYEKRWQELGRLMAEAQQGERASYRKLLSGLTSELESFVNHKASFLDRTSDIVQETLIAIDRAKHTYDAKKDLKPWVLAIARNKMTDFMRKAKRHSKFLVHDEVALQNAAAVHEESSDRADYLREAIAGLSKNYRDVLELTKLEELPIKDVADRLGISESAVKTRASRGYKMLRQKLERNAHEV